jgi:hypothetical protein
VITTTPKTKKPFFTLTRKNQKGQVAIFVALIFQIVFIFFALLINVGLLVHHKINLQQSTDLAAYYGAMKQAEMLNVIAHVNFQIRQAWKLLTWRYRILGTFGFVSVNANPASSDYIDLPVKFGTGNPVSLTYSDLNTKCVNGSDQYNLTDLPAYCIGHVGFGDWVANGSETTCKVNCAGLSGASQVIPVLSNIGTVNVPGANVAGAINGAINSSNNNLVNICRSTSNMGSAQLANILTSYTKDILMKKKTLNLLFRNLLSVSDKAVDIDGGIISKGAILTLKNNLTEANLSSLGSEIKLMNGISSENPNVAGCDTDTNVFAEIKYQLIQFFLQVCTSPAGQARNDKIESIYEPGTQNISTRLAGAIDAGIKAALNDVLSNQLVSGFEKNPWCNVYFGARASTEPKIPFLPISKVKLNAVAFAKPFGGTIGPWYFKKWNSGDIASDKNSPPTDTQLPKKEINVGAPSAMQSNKDIMLNYSNYVGDQLGLKDHRIVGIYHDFLLTRNLQGSSTFASTLQSIPDRPGPIFKKPIATSWPRFENWSHISNDVDATSYDPLAIVGGANSHLRDLEISVLAPNQFELSYYSIDSDFYNNYYKGRLDNSKGLINTLKTISSSNEIVFVRPDYGFSSTSIAGVPRDYSVRHQLAVVDQVFKNSAGGVSQLLTGSASLVADKYFTFIPKSPASLLTGWTFLNLTNAAGYSTFPIDSTGTTMPFGKCKDASYLTDEYKSLADPSVNPPKPPTPGNCVTGGRTGYSVKIVSQEAINGPQGDIGGPGTGGQPIRNPIPPQFLNFQ